MSQLNVNTINEYATDNGVTIDTVLIKDGEVDGIDVSAIGTWQDWTPTLTNGTLGNGTVTARYVQVGKLVTANFLFVLGSTSAISGDFNFTLPVTAARDNFYVASLFLIENGVKDAVGVPAMTTTNFFCRASNSSGTYTQNQTMTSSVPFSWGTDDKIIAGFTYESV